MELASVQVISVLRSVFTSQEALWCRPDLREDQVIVIYHPIVQLGNLRPSGKAEAPVAESSCCSPFPLYPLRGLGGHELEGCESTAGSSRAVIGRTGSFLRRDPGNTIVGLRSIFEFPLEWGDWGCPAQCAVLRPVPRTGGVQFASPCSTRGILGLPVPLPRWHQAQQPPFPQGPFALNMGSGSGSGRQGEGPRGGPGSYFGCAGPAPGEVQEALSLWAQAFQ